MAVIRSNEQVEITVEVTADTSPEWEAVARFVNQDGEERTEAFNAYSDDLAALMDAWMSPGSGFYAVTITVYVAPLGTGGTPA
ncbi:hypothetical protein SEA_LILBEANIE_45 [Gordonia phage Lilbeanie]|uniref:Uncharacterized protein n=1 Tax=Gordonia phage Lilbeanie TaxID=2794947 RepID=A0A7T1KS99_9CAUD|nr:hypothetical protein J1773_gp45 [Gordonia phage Lilbeanie]QPO17123.1 hypothetical protein SEA_LILBEANIE_45 [Gordonia phage Lilbeanie]